VLTLLAEAGDIADDPIPVVIETDHGLWVAALRATSREIYPINPPAASRYRRNQIRDLLKDFYPAALVAFAGLPSGGLADTQRGQRASASDGAAYGEHQKERPDRFDRVLHGRLRADDLGGFFADECVGWCRGCDHGSQHCGRDGRCRQH
jgi:hypothetical protein